LGRGEPESRRLEATQQLAALHDGGAGRDHEIAVLLGDVVVIALETATRYLVGVGERVELVQ
jgi:hypothetical protein